jgi:CMP-N-acetylneuraminic acid synthetase
MGGMVSNIIGMVAVKGDSKRFPDKCFQEIDGKPLYAHNVDILIDSELIKCVYVLTDDERVYKHYEKNDKVTVLYESIRHHHGEKDIFEVWKWGIYAIDDDFDYVVTVLGDCVGHTADDIKNAIGMMAKSDDIWEVRSFDKQGYENGIIVFDKIVFSRPCVSAYMSMIFTDGREIHYESEL